MNIDSVEQCASTHSQSDTNLEVLFVDSFDSIENDAFTTHDGKRCGLIQFSRPVIIHELLLIPLFETAVIENGAITLGATIPPEFDITFYVNDLKAEEAATFLDIGTFAYSGQNGRYKFSPDALVPTDGLFFRGNFENVTLSVHGVQVSILSGEEPTENDANCDTRDIHQQSQSDSRVQAELVDPSSIDSSHYNLDNVHPRVSTRSPHPMTPIKSPSPPHSIKSSSSRASSNNARNNVTSTASPASALPKSFSRYIRDDDRGRSSSHSRNDRYGGRGSNSQHHHYQQQQHHSRSRNSRGRSPPSPENFSYSHPYNRHNNRSSCESDQQQQQQHGYTRHAPYRRRTAELQKRSRSRSSSRSSERRNRYARQTVHSFSPNLDVKHHQHPHPLPPPPPRPHLLSHPPQQPYLEHPQHDSRPSSAADQDDFDKNQRAFSPLSNASSISATSLRSVNNDRTGSTAGSVKSPTPVNSPKPTQLPAKTFEKELFESLSSEDDFSDMEPETVVEKMEEEEPLPAETENSRNSFKRQEDIELPAVKNFEKISWSSDDELENGELDSEQPSMDGPEVSVNGSMSQEPEDKNKLEEISSDEEIPNDDCNDFDMLNLAPEVDDEMDDSFDVKKSLFDPSVLDQLEEIAFPLNNFNSTFNIDSKQLSLISENVVQKFGSFYGASKTEEPRFDENFIRDVEQLSLDIMKLSLPLGERSSESAVLKQDFAQLIEALVNITKDALNFECAISQKQGLKVRHLKAGIKLFISLFYSLDVNSEVLTVLIESDLAYHLMVLYEKPYMTLSMRLLLLNGLSIACDHPQVVDYVISKQLVWSESSPTGCRTIYQQTLEWILSSKASSRLQSAFEEFLTKVHLFEFCESLSRRNSATVEEETGSATTTEMFEQLNAIFIQFSNRIHRPLRLFSELPQFDVKSAPHASASLLLLSAIQTEKSAEFNICKNRLSCTHTSCPASKVGFFAQKSVYRFMQRWNILELIATSLESSTDEGLNRALVELLDMITSHHQGRCFLLQDSNNVRLANRIHKILLEKFNAIGSDFITRLFTFKTVDTILYNIHSDDSSSFDHSGSELAHRALFTEQCGVVRQLLILDSMIHLDGGMLRKTVLSILTSDHNFDGIAAFLLAFKHGATINEISMVAFMLASRIAVFCVQNMPERNLFHFLDSYAEPLMKAFSNIAILRKIESYRWGKFAKFQAGMNTFVSLERWFNPLKNIPVDSKEDSCVALVVAILRKYDQNIREKIASQENPAYRVFEFDPEIVMAFKMLTALFDPVADYFKNQDPDKQLKYKANLIHFYSSDCLSQVFTILDALGETFTRPSHLKYLSASTGDSNTQASFVLQLARLGVRSSSLILRYVASSIGEKFQDTSPVLPLLRVFHFMSFFMAAHPEYSCVHQDARLVQEEIVATLQTVYCRVFTTQTDSVDKMKSSLWNRMIKIVFEFLSSKAKNIVSGLQVLNKLLPGSSAHPLELEFNSRKLWAGHIHLLATEIENLCSMTLLTDCQPVRQEFLQFCSILSELHSPSVMLLSKILAENILVNLNAAMKARQERFPNDERMLRNVRRVLGVVCDLFERSAAFRIGALCAFSILGASDVGRKSSTRIYPILTKMFEFFDSIKFNIGERIDADSLLKHVLATSGQESLDIQSLFSAYYEENKKLIFEKENSNFSEKSLEKYLKNSSNALNDFFERISQNILNDQVNGTEVKNEPENGLYSSEFISVHHNLAARSVEVVNSLQPETETSLKMNFFDIAKQYLKLDSSTLCRTFEAFYSTIVSEVAPIPDKKPEVEEVKHPSDHSNHMPKRALLRAPRRNNWNSRMDLFRSRAPNTSRPPSMHVDDFEAMGTHGNSSGPTKRISHHAALLQNNSAPYAKQHPDAFLRKKPIYSLTSAPGHGYK